MKLRAFFTLVALTWAGSADTSILGRNTSARGGGGPRLMPRMLETSQRGREWPPCSGFSFFSGSPDDTIAAEILSRLAVRMNALAESANDLLAERLSGGSDAT